MLGLFLAAAMLVLFDAEDITARAVTHDGPAGEHGTGLVHQDIVRVTLAKLIRLKEEVVAVKELGQEV